MPIRRLLNAINEPFQAAKLPKAGDRVVLDRRIALSAGDLPEGASGVVAGTRRAVAAPGDVVGWILLDRGFPALSGGRVLPIWSNDTPGRVAKWRHLRSLRPDSRHEAET